MQYDFKIEKNKQSGWEARTEINLGVGYERHKERTPENSGDRILSFSTRKNSYGKFYTSATSFLRIKREGMTINQSVISFGGDPEGDYYATVKAFPELKRATEKSVSEAHKSAFDLFAAHIETAKKNIK